MRQLAVAIIMHASGCHTLVFFSSGTVVVNFTLSNATVDETDGILQVILGVFSGDDTIERNITLNVFSTSGSALGKHFLEPVQTKDQVTCIFESHQ